MKFSQPNNKSEFFWWALLATWVLLIIFWHPPRPMVLTDAPSYGFGREDYRVFYDLVGEEVKQVSRRLDRKSAIPEDADVLVLISPSGQVSAEERESIIQWVEDSAGVLLLVHPFFDDSNESVESFARYHIAPLSSFTMFDESHSIKSLSFSGLGEEDERAVPTMSTVSNGDLSTISDDTLAFLKDSDDVVFGTMDWVGSGRVYQIATTAVLDNEALGSKETHLLVAALLDDIGRNFHWVFDESFNDIQSKPAIFQLIASSHWRPILLHVFFLGIFIYWWKSSRLGKKRVFTTNPRIREVTTLARDIGLFYHRARKSAWALHQLTSYLKAKLNKQDLLQADASRAEHLIRQATELLDTYEIEPKENDNIAVMRKIAALCYRADKVKKRKE